ncbi:hypothetical protein [Rhizobium sp.]|uniref:hypothetical protein n=1 Tax=Rhizobium sp. TaxID=391 RepID=UPI002AA722C5
MALMDVEDLAKSHLGLAMNCDSLVPEPRRNKGFGELAFFNHPAFRVDVMTIACLSP